MPLSYDITCLCGTNAQTVELVPPGDGASNGISLTLCHCDLCRHSSGQLWTSYYPIARRPTTGDEQRIYRSEDGLTARYFCRVCGCHLFRQTALQGDLAGEITWEVATGTIKGPREPSDQSPAQYTHHAHVSDTKDGGAAVWLRAIDGEATQQHRVSEGARSARSSEAQPPTDPDDRLPASCACGTVRFSVTRPNQASYELHSPYSDMIHVFATTPVEVRSNPRGDKWWIMGDGRKYMTRTCACRSCRLFSGFEIQAWSFIPRANIFMHPVGSEADADCLDFSKPSTADTLHSYSSSPGVTREFCGNCGATVFWHCEERPDLIDISVGLFRAEEGARADSWLEWWTDRVSFDEETEVGRHGSAATTARGLVNSLAEGLKTWK